MGPQRAAFRGPALAAFSSVCRELLRRPHRDDEACLDALRQFGLRVSLQDVIDVVTAPTAMERARVAYHHYHHQLCVATLLRCI
eukprot:11207615-Lingulodinium_polyedra.AAC.1